MGGRAVRLWWSIWCARLLLFWCELYTRVEGWCVDGASFFFFPPWEVRRAGLYSSSSCSDPCLAAVLRYVDIVHAIIVRRPARPALFSLPRDSQSYVEY